MSTVKRTVGERGVPEGAIQTTEAVRCWYDTSSRARKGEAVVLTYHGKPDLVLIGYDEYEDLQRAREEIEGRRR